AKLNDEVLEFAAKRSGQFVRSPVITRNYVRSLPMSMVDVGHVKQALLNIYLNAFQALEGATDPKVDVSIDLDEAQDRVVVAITDNGPGIARDDLCRIFDPFFTTRARGTGLGLSITRRLIEAGGGEIVLKSKKGRGTTVEVHLDLRS